MKMQHYGRVWAVAALVLVNAAFSAAAAYSEADIDDVWNVPGARGTIDFRYPDYIVEPLVDCPSEGVFPHPRNCTWYYRCYDRMGLGFYWRAYFECEAGTVFSDGLDQCVFGSANDNCGGVVTEGPVTKRPVTNRPVTEAPVTEAPVTERPVVTCNNVLEGCSSRNICPTNLLTMHTQQISSSEVCAVAEKRCSDGKKTPLCPSTHIYEKDTQKCILQSKLCATTSDPRPTVPIFCEDVFEGCEDILACAPWAPDVIRTVRQCEVSTKCYRDQTLHSKTPFCPAGSVLEPFSDKCIKKIKHLEYCKTKTPKKPTPPTCKVVQTRCLESQTCDGETKKSLRCFVHFECSMLRNNQNAAFLPRFSTILKPVFRQEVESKCIPVPTCTVTIVKCGVEYFCPASTYASLFVRPFEACEAIKQCVGKEDQDYCRAGLYFNKKTEQCEAADVYNGNKCITDVIPDSAIVCMDELTGCRNFYHCPISPFQPQLSSLCDLVRTCRNEKSEVLSTHNMCAVKGHKYSALSNTCMEDITDNMGCQVAVTPPHQPTCSVVGRACTQRPVCGSAATLVDMCYQYFACRTTRAAGSTTLVAPFRQAEQDDCIKLPDTCDDENPIVSGCSEEAICGEMRVDSTSQFVPAKEVCRVAKRNCRSGSVNSICPAGQLYVKSEKKCIPESDVCRQRDRGPFAAVCYDELVNCQDETVCPDSGRTQTVTRYCTLNRKCMTKSGKVFFEEPLCQDGVFYPASNQCAPKPSGTCDTVPAPLPKLKCKLEREECHDLCYADPSTTALSCRRQFSCETTVSASTSLRSVLALGYFRGATETCEWMQPVTCNEIRSDDCKFEAFCPWLYHQSQFIGTVNVCRIADVWCSNGTKSHQVCNDNELYEPATKNCRLSSSICPRPKARPQLPFLCTNVVENCQGSFSCASSRQSTVSHRYCDMHRVCSQATATGFLKTISKTNVCPNGEVFDVNSNRCIDTPKGVTACNKHKQLTCKIITETCQESTICQNSMKVLMCHHLFDCGDHLNSTFQSTDHGVGCVSIDELKTTCKTNLQNCKNVIRCPNFSKTNFISQEKTCDVAQVVCTNGTTTDICTKGNVYHESQKICVPGNTACTIEKEPAVTKIVCKDVFYSCKEKQICPDSKTNFPQTVRRCDIRTVCKQDNIVKSNETYCQAGEEFDAFTNSCVDPADDRKCPGDLGIAEGVKSTCQTYAKKCEKKPICNNSDYGYKCVQLFSCDDKSPRTATLDLYGDRRAVHNPTFKDDECITVTNTNETIKINCNHDQQIPNTDQIVKFMCTKAALCTFNEGKRKYHSSQHLCEEYYRCVTNWEGILTPVVEKCSTGQIFSINEEKCIHFPGERFNCSNPPAQNTVPTVQNPIVIEENPVQIINQTDTITLSITCSSHDQIPESNQIKNANCVNKRICDSTHDVFKVYKESLLCHKFYVCQLNEDGQGYHLQVRTCNPGTMFSYEDNECINTGACKSSINDLLQGSSLLPVGRK